MNTSAFERTQLHLTSSCLSSIHPDLLQKTLVQLKNINQLKRGKLDALIWELKARNISVLESALCVCLYMFTYLCGDQQPLWGQNPAPCKFEGAFEAQNVVLGSGL